jgi:hypothetical protein
MYIIDIYVTFGMFLRMHRHKHSLIFVMKTISRYSFLRGIEGILIPKIKLLELQIAD